MFTQQVEKTSISEQTGEGINFSSPVYFFINEYRTLKIKYTI